MQPVEMCVCKLLEISAVILCGKCKLMQPQFLHKKWCTYTPQKAEEFPLFGVVVVLVSMVFNFSLVFQQWC